MSLINRTTQFVGLENNLLGLQRVFNVSQAVNGGIDFGESTQTAESDGTAYSGNMNGQWANVTAPGTPNTEFAIPHNLNRIPTHYPIVIADRNATLYQLPDTGTVWTTTNIYVKCSVASAKLRVFIA